MPEHDMFAYLVRKLGEPEHARKVGADEAAHYADRLPEALLRFWQEHGRGAYKDGSYWICDPAPYKGVIDAIFKGDPEFDPARMTTVGYDAFARLWVWHDERHDVTLDLLRNEAYNPPEVSKLSQVTGQKLSDNFSIGCYLTNFISFDPTKDEDGEELMPQARARLGPLEHDEVYGFFPALQLGGARRAENLRRVSGPEHMLFLASLEPLTVTSLTEPEPGHPYGRIVPVRRIGPP